jgi:hypothetical protein
VFAGHGARFLWQRNAAWWLWCRPSRGAAVAMPSGMPEESQIESAKHQDKSDIHHQPFPEPVSEEQQIDGNDNGRHQRDVNYHDCLSSHFESSGSRNFIRNVGRKQPIIAALVKMTIF